jgi:hypothetical protein
VYCYYGPPGDDSHAAFGMVYQTTETRSCEDLQALSGKPLADELVRRMTRATHHVNDKMSQHAEAIFRDELPVHGTLAKWATNPKLFPLAYGHVLEELTALAVSRDECLSQYLDYVPNAEQNKAGGMPDFRGKGAAAGHAFDITTRDQMRRKKESNPNKRKPSYHYVLYERQLEFGAVGR